MISEPAIRHKLDNWKLWVGVAYFGLAAVVVALFFINQNTQKTVVNQAKDEAAHKAEIVANADAQFNQCIVSMPTLGEINKFISGVQIVESALVLNSAAVVTATPMNDPQYNTRVRNLERLQDAQAAASHVKFPVPTRAQCKSLRARLMKEG